MSGRGKRSSSRRKYEMLGVVRRKCANALKNAKNSYSTCFRGESVVLNSLSEVNNFF